MRGFLFGLILGVALFCGQVSFAKTVVVVSIEPQVYFVQKIGGSGFQVEVMVPPGAEPHAYEPRPRQMQMITKAKAYLAIGVPFEKVWLKRFKQQNPQLRIFYLDKGIKKYPLEEQVVFVQKRDSSIKGELDPHIWLGLDEAKQIAKNTFNALAKIFPDQKAVFKKNLEQLLIHLDQLKKDFNQKLRLLKGKTFLVFHPSWGYFARCFGLKQMAIEVKGREPSAREMAEIIKLAREKKIAVIFIQPQFARKKAEVIAKQLGARVVSLDPLARNWEKNLLKVVDSLLLK